MREAPLSAPLVWEPFGPIMLWHGGSGVMLAVAGRWPLDGDARKAYLRAADTIRSDYENRRVLTALVNQEPR